MEEGLSEFKSESEYESDRKAAAPTLKPPSSRKLTADGKLFRYFPRSDFKARESLRHRGCFVSSSHTATVVLVVPRSIPTQQSESAEVDVA